MGAGTASPGPERGTGNEDRNENERRHEGLLYLQKTWLSCGSGVEPERSVAQASVWSKCVNFAVSSYSGSCMPVDPWLVIKEEEGVEALMTGRG